MHMIRLPGTVSRPAETMLRPIDMTSAIIIVSGVSDRGYIEGMQVELDLL